MYNKTHTDADAIMIRIAGEEDSAELKRLAQLDSTPLPTAPLLVAFADGRAVAAISLRDGTAVADPFRRTAEIMAMLEARLTQVRLPNRGRGLRRRIFGGLRADGVAAQPADSVRPLA
jgi:hypothetical protein